MGPDEKSGPFLMEFWLFDKVYGKIKIERWAWIIIRL